MNPGRISAALRRQVRERARERCEYCLLAEVQAFFPHEPDHIISQKHGGKGEPCAVVLRLQSLQRLRHRFRGSIVENPDTIIQSTLQRWNDHFQLRQGRIFPLTMTGRATERLLRFNLPHRIEVRRQARAT